MDRVVYFAARRENGGGWKVPEQEFLFQLVILPPLLMSTFFTRALLQGFFEGHLQLM